MTPERAAEYLSLLAAKVAPWEAAIGSFNALRAADIALAMGMVQNVPARLLMRIKYADQPEHMPAFESAFLSALERGMLGHIADLAAPGRWKVPRPGFIRDMGRLALAEHLSPKLCPQCKGRGEILWRRRLKKTCPKCAGSGHIAYTDAYRARLLGVSHDAWCRFWRDRYHAIGGVLDTYDDLGKSALAKRLR